ncbi:DUF1801 domain-containing protein [bacterium]|nr:DUF1801 domain-containing protein [bacterium]
MREIENPEVAAVFNSYSQEVREKLMFFRQLILETASMIDEVGEIEETLKWGEPSYLTPKSKSGSTIRINKKKSAENQVAIYFKCTANLVSSFRVKFPAEFHYEDNRAIVFNLFDEVDINKLRKCIALALTYHLNKKLDDVERWRRVDQYLALP